MSAMDGRGRASFHRPPAAEVPECQIAHEGRVVSVLQNGFRVHPNVLLVSRPDQFSTGHQGILAAGENQKFGFAS